MSDGAGPLYVAVDIGCIECGEPSAVLGIFANEVGAAAVCNEAEARQKQTWSGQHRFEVFEVPGPNRVCRVDYAHQWGDESPEAVWE